MKKKKWAIVAVSLLLVAVLGVGTYFAIPSIVVRNVFDEMYYSIKQEPEAPEPPFWKEKLNGFYYTDTSFTTVGEISKEQSGKARFYEYPYVAEEEQLGVTIGLEQRLLTIEFAIWMENEGDKARGLLIDYTYNKNSKILTCAIAIYDSITPLNGFYKIDEGDMVVGFLQKHSITREQIEGYKHFVLYERLLPDWFAGNAGLSRYSPGNLGSFTYDDRTYEGLEGWTS